MSFVKLSSEKDVQSQENSTLKGSPSQEEIPTNVYLIMVMATLYANLEHA
jgi:hypothetical protein